MKEPQSEKPNSTILILNTLSVYRKRQSREEGGKNASARPMSTLHSIGIDHMGI